MRRNKNSKILNKNSPILYNYKLSVQTHAELSFLKKVFPSSILEETYNCQENALVITPSSNNTREDSPDGQDLPGAGILHIECILHIAY